MYRLNRIFFILLGFVWGIFGVLIILDPTFYHSRLLYHFDFSEAKWPFGLFLIALGILFIVFSFRRKSVEVENKYKERERVLMCPACVKPIQKNDVPKLKCPECNGNLEDLIGFYERHPELREKA